MRMTNDTLNLMTIFLFFKTKENTPTFFLLVKYNEYLYTQYYMYAN